MPTGPLNEYNLFANSESLGASRSSFIAMDVLAHLGRLGFILFCVALLTNAECSPQPLVAPIDNVTISNGASVRGVMLTLGSNLQNISMFVSG